MGAVVSGRRDSVDDLLDGFVESNVGRMVDGQVRSVHEEDERQLHRIATLAAPRSDGQSARAGILAKGIESPAQHAFTAMHGPQLCVVVVTLLHDARFNEVFVRIEY